MKYLAVVLVIVALIAVVLTARSKTMFGNNKVLMHEEEQLDKNQSMQIDKAALQPETIMENNYLKVFRNGHGDVTIYFNIEDDVPFAIGEKMQEINENAYMNGYAWEALLNFVMQNRYPNLLDTVNTDSEAGTYVAYFTDNEVGIESAKTLAELIISLIENEEELYGIVREHADEIEWEDLDN